MPVPKQKPVKNVSKHLGPISLTPLLSKIAEEFIVEEFVKPSVMAVIDDNQFGTVPKSSTTQALISMIHAWSNHTDRNGSTVGVVLFDFRKAFDLIDHCILAGKLKNLDLPSGIVSWITDFLKDRKQRVKLSQECFSEWGTAGVPQGTKLGPWLFMVMINDLNLGNLDLWKFVDDMTTAEPVPNNGVSKIQDSVDDLVNKSSACRFQLNVPKCKELRISFAKTEPKFDPIVVNSKPLEIVETAKVLGLNISCDLKWNAHLSEVLKKGASRLYFLRQLKRSNIATKDLFSFYLVCVRPITE